MKCAVVPTRGSDRVIRRDWIQAMAMEFDLVLVLYRDWDFGSYPFPSNVEVIPSDKSLPDRRQMGAELAIEAGADLIWQIDDDTVTHHWHQLVELQELSLTRFPWLSCVEIPSRVRRFYNKGVPTTEAFGGLVRPALQMTKDACSFVAIRATAFQETEGYFPFLTLEDYDLCLQMAAKGWLSASCPEFWYDQNRQKLNNKSRQGEGGMIPEEREAQTEPAVNMIRERHGRFIRSFRSFVSRHGTPTHSMLVDWPALAAPAIARWGNRKDLFQFLATRIRMYRGQEGEQ